MGRHGGRPSQIKVNNQQPDALFSPRLYPISSGAACGAALAKSSPRVGGARFSGSLFFGGNRFAPDLFPPCHRTDSSFGCRNEVPKYHRFRRPGPLRRFFQCLLQVQPLPVKQFVGALHLSPQRRTKTRPPQPNNIDCSDTVPADDDCKRRDIFSDCAGALH